MEVETVNATQILAWAHQQQNILNEMVPLLERFVTLQGENPVHTLSLMTPNGGRPRVKGKRRKKRVTGHPKRKASTNGHNGNGLATEGSLRALVLEVVRKAKKPLEMDAITAKLQAMGWQTKAKDPHNVVQQSVWYWRKQKQLKKFGSREHGFVYGLPEWQVAADAARLVSRN